MTYNQAIKNNRNRLGRVQDTVDNRVRVSYYNDGNWNYPPWE